MTQELTHVRTGGTLRDAQSSLSPGLHRILTRLARALHRDAVATTGGSE